MRAAKTLPAEGVTVRLRGGTYEVRQTLALGAEDFGSPGGPIVYCAAPGERVTFLAALSCSATGSLPYVTTPYSSASSARGPAPASCRWT